jgi:hypothetical protein
MAMNTNTGESRLTACTGASALLHAVIGASFALFVSGLNADAAERSDLTQANSMRWIPATIAEGEQEQRAEPQPEPATPVARNGDGRPATHGREVRPVSAPPEPRSNRSGVHERDDSEPLVANRRSLGEVPLTGLLGILGRDLVANPRGPVAAWGREDVGDAQGAFGRMWGSMIEGASGGLGLLGTGEGDDESLTGTGIVLEGIGDLASFDRVGRIGDLMARSGKGGSSTHSRPPPKVASTGPRLREEAFQRTGNIPAEVIQRIVRQNFGRFRNCYEDGLRVNPALTGRVAVAFIIDRKGEVSMARDGGSDLSDPHVVSCVVRAFGNLSFPQPEGGIVTVIYPILFTPGE